MHKNQRRIYFVVPLIVAFVFAGPVLALELGDTAPKIDVEMKNVDGNQLAIQDIKGEKGTLVIFTCNSCPWVKAWEDRIAEIGNTFQHKEIGVIAINSNDPDRNSEDSFSMMQQRAEKKGFTFPYVMDATSDIARAFGATRTPEAFLFNSEGKLVYHGTIDDNARNPEEVEETYLKDALNAVVAGNEVPTPETKALGCTIKFRDA